MLHPKMQHSPYAARTHLRRTLASELGFAKLVQLNKSNGQEMRD
jgi:hypothetical protein